MGMSAGQARLLSITKRISNNEFRSQMITNSKLRLAQESAEASDEYMNALNSQQLMFGTFDDDGNKSYSALTPNLLTTYCDLKNQYAMVTPSGKILVSGTDKQNYESAIDMTDFLYKYDVAKTDNPKYPEYLTELFGTNYSNFYDASCPNKYTQTPEGTPLKYIILFLDEIQNIDIDTISEKDYNDKKAMWLQALIDTGLGVSDSNNGLFAILVDILNNMPEKVPEPNLLEYAQVLLSPQCWNDTGINSLKPDNFSANNNNIWHMEHVLAQYLWSSPGSVESMTVNIDGTDETIINKHNKQWALSDGGGNGDDPMRVRDVLDKPENAQLKEDLQKLYYQIALHIDTYNTNGGLTDGTISNIGNNKVMSNTDIAENYYNLINELLEAVANDILEAGPSDARWYDSGFDEYQLQLNNYHAFTTKFPSWVEEVKNAVEDFEYAIANVPPIEIPDETDAKYQWYVNLWYRMGSQSETIKGDGSAYKEIDPNLFNSSEWLEFALEHGMVTLEQAQFNADGSVKYPGMGTYDWNSIIYTSAVDIVSQEDEVAIARAEVKYKNKLTEIDNKDKKYEQDLKKLDTEHTALQTEYDSIKEVLSKNVERSFKAFS